MFEQPMPLPKTAAPSQPPEADSTVSLAADSPLMAAVSRLDCALAPMVSLTGGHCFAYQAVLCHHDEAGFATPSALFDACADADLLGAVQGRLWEKAIAKFAKLAAVGSVRLFLPLDHRPCPGLAQQLRGLLAQYNVPESAVILEISQMAEDLDPREWLAPWRALGCKIALERFGGVASHAHLLHAAEPDFIKIDPFFVAALDSDSRKKLLVSQMVSMAHLLGMLVVATGVTSEQQLSVCKEIGCDLAQGPLVGAAMLDPAALPSEFAALDHLTRRERRVHHSDQRMILDQMEFIPPLKVDAELTEVFELLRQDTRQTFVPIVDPLGQPLGIVREANIKNFAYSPFGKSLISNKGLGRKLKDFIVRCPIADVHKSVETIISIYSADEEAEGLILVKDMRCVGFLSARSIIRVINEKSLAQARDQNPLTKLPGNALINQFVTDSLGETATGFVYAYVDFDNFKPFNDKYGFRQGDRAILLFAELMRKTLPLEQHFLGHIGGDDFFVGFKGASMAQAQPVVAALLESFRSDAESFYDAETRATGHITAHDREGVLKTFPLLSASAVLVAAPEDHPPATIDDVSALIADRKKQAKMSPDKLACVTLN